jgi:glucose-1-phosphate cytidylyltransferase
MKVVILAGGRGTRFAEETELRPKPMIEIGGRPILWHIMKIYSANGINDFIICCGYKGYLIKEYFANYSLHMSDVTFNFEKNEMTVHKKFTEPWNVTLVDTGSETMTGGRLKRVKEYIGDQTFCLTYGDGVSDIDINALVEFHKRKKVLATLTAVRPGGRFGRLVLKDDKVKTFIEKPLGDGGWINGGFFVFEPDAINLIDGDHTILEKEPLETLAGDGSLAVYKHKGFWEAMDTLRDKMHLEDLWQNDQAPWKNIDQ